METLRHEADTREEWNESYYFNFYDACTCIGGFTRIGFKPNRKEGVSYLFLFYKDEILGFLSQEEVAEVPERIQVGGISFCPGWEVTFSGTMKDVHSGQLREVRLQLEYTPVHGEFSYLTCLDEEEYKIARVVGEDHYEQIGCIRGTVTVDGEEHAISGFGERDHSWGERDWNAPQLWIYVTAHFDTDFGVNIAKMLIRNAEIDVGFIMKNGENIPVERVEAHTVSEGGLQRRAEYRIWDRNGDIYVLAGDVVKTVQIPYRKGENLSILNENLSTFACRGKKGFGIVEYLVRVQE